MKVALTAMESQMLKWLGFGEPKVEQVGRDFRVFVIKEDRRVEALGRTPEQATASLIRLIVR